MMKKVMVRFKESLLLFGFESSLESPSIHSLESEGVAWHGQKLLVKNPQLLSFHFILDNLRLAS